MSIPSREPGAPAAAGEISLCIPHLGGREAEYLLECVTSNFVSSVGPFVGRFERMIREYLGMPHAVAVQSGTAALHLALQAVGVEAGDEVLVPSLTFIAPVNAIRYVGAWPVFVDSEPVRGQMDVDRVAEFIGRCQRTADGLINPRSGRRIRAIIPVHLLGHPVDMDPLLDLARRQDLTVIEDATESLGASYRGRMVGALADISCLSFNGNKLITSGGGGMVVARDDRVAARVRYLSTQAKVDPVEFVHGDVGYNYRLTNVHAALGCAQMERIADHLAAKRRIADRYVEALGSIPGIRMPREADWAHSAWWMSVIAFSTDRFPSGSRPMMHALDRAGIQTRPLWQPVHLSPAHSGSEGDCPVATRLQFESLNLPSSVGLTSSDQDRVIEAIITIAAGLA